MKKLLAGAAISLLLGGCGGAPSGTTTGTPKPAVSSTAKISATPTAMATLTPSPGATATPNATGSPTASADWQEFKAPDGSFEILMPGKPNVVDKDGQLVVVSTLGDTDHKLGLVKHNKKTGIKDVKDLSEEAVGAIIKEMEADGSKVTKHDTGNVQGHPALNLVVTMADKTVGDMVMVFTDDHMYQLMTLRPEKSTPFKEADETKFATSFKLHEKAGGKEKEKDKDE